MGWQNIFAAVIQAGNTTIINSGGLFVYNGIPALGNLVVSLTPSAGVDKYGNVYQVNETVYGPNGAYINTSSLGGAGNNPAILFRGQSATHMSLNPQILSQILNAGLANEQENITITSGKAGSGLDDAAIALYSESADGTIQATYILEAGGTQLASLNKGRFTFNTPITSTSGTQTAQTTVLTDTWHRVTVFDNGWAASGGNANGMAYRLTTDQELEIVFEMINATAVGNSLVITFTGPAVPAIPQNLCIEWNNPQANNSASQPWAFIDASGNFSFIGIQVANKPMFGRVKAILPSF